MQYMAWIKSWGTQSSCLHLLLSDLSLAKLLPTPMDIHISLIQLHHPSTSPQQGQSTGHQAEHDQYEQNNTLTTKVVFTEVLRNLIWFIDFFRDWNWKCLRMSERYCGFILITMPGKNRISIARHCLPSAGTRTSWYIVMCNFFQWPSTTFLWPCATFGRHCTIRTLCIVIGSH